MDRGMDGGHGEKPLRMSMRRIHIPHLKGGKFVRFPLDLYRRHLWCPAVFWPAKNFHHIIIWGIQRGALALHSGRFRIPRGALQCGAFAPHPPEAARLYIYARFSKGLLYIYARFSKGLLYIKYYKPDTRSHTGSDPGTHAGPDSQPHAVDVVAARGVQSCSVL